MWVSRQAGRRSLRALFLESSNGFRHGVEGWLTKQKVTNGPLPNAEENRVMSNSQLLSLIASAHVTQRSFHKCIRTARVALCVRIVGPVFRVGCGFWVGYGDILYPTNQRSCRIHGAQSFLERFIFCRIRDPKFSPAMGKRPFEGCRMRCWSVFRILLMCLIVGYVLIFVGYVSYIKFRSSQPGRCLECTERNHWSAQFR